ncbi:hypothetical protein PSHT_12994 [Puccinia striiformis]|uniref:Uncharacterized protein n=1 Tax=Puccinia striiformis TaxID=27350 RepID=A0A2S4UT19_9BASI|nr:hypothetical protein PSHT_12994 [Puccinia striiformis]
MEKIATQFVTTISVNGHFLMDDLGEDQASSLFSMKNPEFRPHQPLKNVTGTNSSRYTISKRVVHQGARSINSHPSRRLKGNKIEPFILVSKQCILPNINQTPVLRYLMHFFCENFDF